MNDERHVDVDGLPVADPNFEAKQKEKFLAFLEGNDADEPALYATDPGWFRDLSAQIPGLLVESAGGVCPFQSEGTIHGYPYYFRYRHGHARLEVRHPHTDDMSAEHLYSAGINHGDDLDGFLDRTEFYDLMLALVPKLERAPFLWEFLGKKVTVEDVANPVGDWEAELLAGNKGQARPKPERKPMDLRFTVTDETEVYRTWGTTPAEAYARLNQTSTYLLSHGWSEEKQAELKNAKDIDPNPINVDTRVFPDPEPVFAVRT